MARCLYIVHQKFNVGYNRRYCQILSFQSCNFVQ
ncbi:hypothetical protein KSF78_0009505 [Schistosoma japonicum]|nr:hypothetical protein KSF78_0009505 [Schistosoma japonicum]